jgi:hypothetical protein
MQVYIVPDTNKTHAGQLVASVEGVVPLEDPVIFSQVLVQKAYKRQAELY